MRKQSPAGLLRPKKGLGEPGPSLAVPPPSARGPAPTSPDKAKLATEKGRKARKLRGPKEPGFEAGPEASDDDLWTRRRSERIFLHDASAAAPAPSSAAPAPKPSRGGKGGAVSPRKDTGRAKERKDPRKVGAQHRCGAMGRRWGPLVLGTGSELACAQESPALLPLPYRALDLLSPSQNNT